MKKQKLKIAVIGASGKMGQSILDLLQFDHEAQPTLGISADKNNFKKQISLVKAHQKITDIISEIDVWIDFSNFEIFDEVLELAVKSKKPLVSGTTGLTDAQFKNMQAAAKKIPIAWSSNFSNGIAVLQKALESFAELNGFDFYIEEIHHTKKKDRPSGTAKTLHKKLSSVVKRKLDEPISIRVGGVFGVHRVGAASEEEVLIFEHQALNRNVFARGAIQKAKWLVKQKPGYYGQS